MNSLLGVAKRKQSRSPPSWQSKKQLTSFVSSNPLVFCDLLKNGFCKCRMCERAYKWKGYGSKEYEIRSCKKKWWVCIGDLASMGSCSREIDFIAAIAMNDFLLQKFLKTFSCFFAPPRPNIATRFCLIDASQPLLANFPSPLVPSIWARLLSWYPGFLRIHLSIIIRFKVELG